MKAVRTIISIIACFLIAVGIFSVVGYELYFRHAEPELPSTTQQADDPAPAESTPESDPATMPEPDPTPVEPTAEEQKAQELLSGMTLEQKLYQMFFITPESITGVEAATKAGDTTKQALQDNPVGGILYSEKNLEDTKQVKELLSGTQSFLTDAQFFPAFLAIDEEGGDIAPVSTALKTTAFDSMADLGKAGDVKAVSEMGKTIASEISALGFNVNFAPIADLADDTHNNELGSRSFGLNPETTASMVAAVVSSEQSNGVACAVSYFPGLGSISDIAHIDRTDIARSVEDMQHEDLVSFRSAVEAEAGFIVVSHAILSELDDQRPCSMSPSTMKLLREDLGFRGVIITDLLDVPSITDHYATKEAVVNAVSAGADMLLCPEDLDEAIQALLKAVDDKTITEDRIDESVTRILAAKIALGLIK